jgi:hypothetical protein
MDSMEKAARTKVVGGILEGSREARMEIPAEFRQGSMSGEGLAMIRGGGEDLITSLAKAVRESHTRVLSSAAELKQGGMCERTVGTFISTCQSDLFCTCRLPPRSIRAFISRRTESTTRLRRSSFSGARADGGGTFVKGGENEQSQA